MKIQVAPIPKIGGVDARPHTRQNVSIEAKIKEVCLCFCLLFEIFNGSFLWSLIVFVSSSLKNCNKMLLKKLLTVSNRFLLISDVIFLLLFQSAQNFRSTDWENVEYNWTTAEWREGKTRTAWRYTNRSDYTWGYRWNSVNAQRILFQGKFSQLWSLLGLSQ